MDKNKDGVKNWIRIRMKSSTGYEYGRSKELDKKHDQIIRLLRRTGKNEL